MLNTNQNLTTDLFTMNTNKYELKPDIIINVNFMKYHNKSPYEITTNLIHTTGDALNEQINNIKNYYRDLHENLYNLYLCNVNYGFDTALFIYNLFTIASTVIMVNSFYNADLIFNNINEFREGCISIWCTCIANSMLLFNNLYYIFKGYPPQCIKLFEISINSEVLITFFLIPLLDELFDLFNTYSESLDKYNELRDIIEKSNKVLNNCVIENTNDNRLSCRNTMNCLRYNNFTNVIIKIIAYFNDISLEFNNILIANIHNNSTPIDSYLLNTDLNTIINYYKLEIQMPLSQIKLLLEESKRITTLFFSDNHKLFGYSTPYDMKLNEKQKIRNEKSELYVTKILNKLENKEIKNTIDAAENLLKLLNHK